MAKNYGFYSEQAILSGCGSSIYEDLEGNMVEVTCVTPCPNGEEYNWTDKVFVGEVRKWIRQGKEERYCYKKMPLKYYRKNLG